MSFGKILLIKICLYISGKYKALHFMPINDWQMGHTETLSLILVDKRAMKFANIFCKL